MNISAGSSLERICVRLGPEVSVSPGDRSKLLDPDPPEHAQSVCGARRACAPQRSPVEQHNPTHAIATAIHQDNRTDIVSSLATNFLCIRYASLGPDLHKHCCKRSLPPRQGKNACLPVFGPSVGRALLTTLQMQMQPFPSVTSTHATPIIDARR